MRVIELMERTGVNSLNRACAYIKDGLIDIQTRTNENTKRYTMSVEADTRYYTFPSDMVKLLKVYRKYDSNGRYIEIPRIMNIQLMQDAASSTAVSDDDLIVI